MKIEFIGWCSDPVDNHDKVWGIALVSSGNSFKPNTYVTFWGRRGKKLQKKTLVGWADVAYHLIKSKEKKGYIRVPEEEVNEVYARFEKDLFKIALSV